MRIHQERHNLAISIQDIHISPCHTSQSHHGWTKVLQPFPTVFAPPLVLIVLVKFLWETNKERKNKNNDDFNVVTNVNYGVASFFSLSEFIWNSKMGITRIIGPKDYCLISKVKTLNMHWTHPSIPICRGHLQTLSKLRRCNPLLTGLHGSYSHQN